MRPSQNQSDHNLDGRTYGRHATAIGRSISPSPPLGNHGGLDCSSGCRKRKISILPPQSRQPLIWRYAVCKVCPSRPQQQEASTFGASQTTTDGLPELLLNTSISSIASGWKPEPEDSLRLATCSLNIWVLNTPSTSDARIKKRFRQSSAQAPGIDSS